MALPERKDDVNSVSPTRNSAQPSGQSSRGTGGNPSGPESTRTGSGLRLVAPAGATRVDQAPNPLQVNRMLWILLALATVFLVSVRIYAQKYWNPAAVSAGSIAEIPILDATAPSIPVLPGELTLRWDAVPAAVQYNLRIHTLEGTPVVDPMIVWGEQWRPSDQLLPGLTPGPYRWSVEAVDGPGRIIARSLPMDLEIE